MSFIDASDRRRRRSLVVAAVILVGLLLFAAYVASDHPRDLTAEITALIETARSEEPIPLSSVLSIQVDRACSFPPYTAPSEIEATVGFGWTSGHSKTLSRGDGHFLVLLFNEGAVAGEALVSREVANVPPMIGCAAEPALSVLIQAEQRVVVVEPQDG